MDLASSVEQICLSDRHLNLILLSTEACNLRCTYCFEDFTHGRMEPGVVQGVKRLLDRRQRDLEQLTLAWFGGEPLLAMDIVREVNAHAQDLFGGRPGFQFRSNLTTNALLLTRQRFEELLGLGVTSFFITFDGPREAHDTQRVRANGRGTFDRIWNNVLALQEVEGQFEVVLRLHVNARNHVLMAPFIETLKATFGHDPRIQPRVQPLARLGGAGDAELPVLEGQSAAAILQRLRGLIHPDPPPASEPHFSICYAAWANSFIIRADGSVNKCSVACDHANNNVGRLESDGRLLLDNARMAAWMRGMLSGEPAELDCPRIGLAGR